jgi:pyruvate/2-oxoglutarate dehydrogenase complex dihydrolipoamide dehydrogenase (E3) component
MSTDYDAIIIGAGQAGVPLATTLAEAGWSVALIERDFVGGTCINTGCTPSKTMIASARIAHLMRRAPEYGVHMNGGHVHVDFREVRDRKREVVRKFRKHNLDHIEKTRGLDFYEGEASFAHSKSVIVTKERGQTNMLSADKIFINVGQRPAILPIPGFDSIPILHEAGLMELDVLPEHLLILGGGYQGVEFAQMFCRLGSRVTIIEDRDQLLSHEDFDIADAVREILCQDGVDVMFNASVEEATMSEDQHIELAVSTDNGGRIIQGSHLLVAVGRTPNTATLNLHNAGVETDDNGYICVNDRLETNVDGIYALGDVNGGPAFTHISYDDFRIIKRNLLYDDSASTRNRLVPYTVFTDPQLGRIGLTETQAREQYDNVKVATMPVNRVARAIETNETRGVMKAVVDGDSDQILGCAILSVQGGEMMSMLEMAMMGNVPYTAIRDGVFAHPTLAESLNNLFATIN